METNKTYKRVPFDIELAKKVQSGEVEGRICNHNNEIVRIICFDRFLSKTPLIGLVTTRGEERLEHYSNRGLGKDGGEDLLIELPEETPKHEFKVGDIITLIPSRLYEYRIIKFKENLAIIKRIDTLEQSTIPLDKMEFIREEKHEFKPFDKVLVRDLDTSEWRPRLYSRKGRVGYCMQDCCEYIQILPYEGNEHLVGTTNNP